MLTSVSSKCYVKINLFFFLLFVFSMNCRMWGDYWLALTLYFPEYHFCGMIYSSRGPIQAASLVQAGCEHFLSGVTFFNQKYKLLIHPSSFLGTSYSWTSVHRHSQLDQSRNFKWHTVWLCSGVVWLYFGLYVSCTWKQGEGLSQYSNVILENLEILHRFLTYVSLIVRCVTFFFVFLFCFTIRCRYLLC